MFRSLLTFSCGIFLLLNATSYSQWKWVHPTPTGSAYEWCKMWDANNWYIAGWWGTFIKTTDGGDSWFINQNAGRRNSASSRSADIYKAYFFNMNKGILVGNSGSVTKTTNGGITFDSIPGTYVNDAWYNIYFVDDNTGFITGRRGNFIETTNGGDDWLFNNSIPSGNISNNYYDIYSPDGTLILVSGLSGNIQRSTDGGNSWTQINTGGSGTLFNMKFLNADTGFVAGSSNDVKLTTNGGLNWISKSPSNSNAWYDMDLRTSGGNVEVYLTGDDSCIYKSTNMGDSWDTLRIAAPGQTFFYPYRSSYIYGDGFLSVGLGGLINQRLGSSQPQQFTKNVRLGLITGNNFDVWAENGTGKVWVVGEAESPGITFDQILYSTDGGNTWTYQPINSSTDLYSISMLNVNTGYVAGTNGEVLKTVNGGVNWIQIATPTTNDLRCVDFVNADTGWIFGVNGTLYKTTNGGGNWVQQTCASTGNDRGSIFILNESTGWIAGGTGTTGGDRICKTTNGGINWVDQNVESVSYELSDIKMLDANTGYVSGVGVIRKTTNGGLNWNALSHPFSNSQQFLGLDFLDSQNGIVLSFAALLRTSDGGQSWEIEHDFVGSDDSRLHMVSPDTAFIAGGYAGVFKNVDGLTGIETTHWFNEAPDNFNLKQNYPNPFNPVTTIEFSIPIQSNVTLLVYDTSGREVKTLINNLQLNRGVVKQTFDGSKLASGVYFYSLLIDDKSIETKKMVLIK